MQNMGKMIANKKADFMFVFKWTMLAFFIIHGSFFTRRFANEDYLHDFYKSGAVVRSGRFIGGITNVMNPWLIGVISACIFGVLIFLIIDMLKINSKFMKILTVFILLSFPTLATGFGYLFMVQVYSFALIFSVLAVYITDKYKFGFILGAVFLMLSLAAYQSYIGVSMTLCIMLILRNWYMDSQSKISKIFQFIAMGILGIILYMLIIKQIYPMLGIVLNNYKGISNMGAINISDLPYLLSRTIRGVREFFSGERFFTVNVFQIYSNVLMFGLLGYYSIEKILYRKIQIYDTMALVAFMILPFCLNIVDIIAPESSASVLTVYALCLVYVLLISMHEWHIYDIAEYKAGKHNGFNIEAYITDVKNINEKFNNTDSKGIERRENRAVVLKIITLVVIVITVMSNMILSSVYYLKMDKVYDATLLFENRLYSRIEAVEGYERDTPIAIMASSGSYYVHGGDIYPEIIEDTGIWQKYIGFNDLAGTRPSYATDRTIRFINNTLNVGAVAATPKQIDDIINSYEYSQMGVYPSQSGIKMINGIVVVNFNN